MRALVLCWVCVLGACYDFKNVGYHPTPGPPPPVIGGADLDGGELDAGGDLADPAAPDLPPPTGPDFAASDLSSPATEDLASPAQLADQAVASDLGSPLVDLARDLAAPLPDLARDLVVLPPDLRPGLVGSYLVIEGPDEKTNPPTYSCRQACALLFGRTEADYSCQVTNSQGDRVHHFQYFDTDGRYHTTPPDGGQVFHEFRSPPCQRYHQDAGEYACWSAYVRDHVSELRDNRIFCWSPPVP